MMNCQRQSDILFYAFSVSCILLLHMYMSTHTYVYIYVYSHVYIHTLVHVTASSRRLLDVDLKKDRHLPSGCPSQPLSMLVPGTLAFRRCVNLTAV